MKLKSTPDGLKAAPITPYRCTDGFLNTCLEMPEASICDKCIKTLDFEASNPALDLTTPMPGNTVFEGVGVWQYQFRMGGEWEIATPNIMSHFDNYEAFAAYYYNQNDCATKRCYQPLSVQEQPLDLTANYGPCDNNYGRDKKFTEIPKAELSPYFQNKIKDMVDVKEQVREEAPKAELSPYFQNKIKQMSENVKASNPELGVEDIACQLTDSKFPDAHNYLHSQPYWYKQGCIDAIKQQQQGLVSINTSELAVLIANDMYIDELHGCEEHQSDVAQIERVIVKYLKTLKQ